MDAKQDQAAAYKTYLHYSVALSHLFTQEYPSQKDLFDKITSSTAFANIQEQNIPDSAPFERLLHLSWHTEMLVTKQSAHADLLNYALPWSMVQRYYAIHHMTRAYFNAFGHPEHIQHADTLNAINCELTTRGDQFPSPWRAVMIGDGSRGAAQVTNIDQPLPTPLNNALYSPYNADPWRYFALLLKTTHSRRIDEEIGRWKLKHGTQRIRDQERQSLIGRRVKSTSIFNFFYRLRIRSNYKDIDLFIVPFIDHAELDAWQKSIVQTLSYTLSMFECMIVRAIGKRAYQRILANSLFPTTTIGVRPINSAFQRWESCLRSYF